VRACFRAHGYSVSAASRQHGVLEEVITVNTGTDLIRGTYLNGESITHL
jgi:hypothetical protein